MTAECELTPSRQITYVALRAAFVTTLNSLLRDSLDPLSNAPRSHEFFGCFPTLHGTAPQIQLECLLRTWDRCNKNEFPEPDLLDAFVLYAAFETLARITSDSHNKSLRMVLNGPHVMLSTSEYWLASQARCLLICLPNLPRTTKLAESPHYHNRARPLVSTSTFELDAAQDELLSLVGRWVAQKELVLGSKGLLTQDEQDLLRAFFEEHPGLVR